MSHQKIYNGHKWISTKTPKMQTWNFLERLYYNPGWGIFECKQTGEIREFKIKSKGLSPIARKHFGLNKP